MIKGLIFDLDGVIVDTAKYHYLAWKQIADELKINFTLKDNELLKGVSRIKSFEIILEIGGIKMANEEQEKYCHKKNQIYLEYVNKMKEDEILSGVKEFLIDAKKNGYKIALGSASKNAQLILGNTKMKNYFDAIIDGEKVLKAKPDPEVFIKGAYELGLKGEECIVFEDALAGVQAAHNANMVVVGIGKKEYLPDANICLDGFLDMTIQNIIDKL